MEIDGGGSRRAQEKVECIETSFRPSTAKVTKIIFVRIICLHKLRGQVVGKIKNYFWLKLFEQTVGAKSLGSLAIKKNMI